MTKGMPRQRQRVLPGQISRLVFRIRQSVLLCYWLIPKSCLPRQGSRQVTDLLSWRDNLLPWLGGKSSASAGNLQPRRENLGWQEICLTLLKSAMAGSPTLPRPMP
ncbi:hypothetical protein V6N13_099147 [Hibiscus sabdariffa]